MFSYIISPLASWLYNLNPSLLPEPPTQVGNPTDVCYLGPNGEAAPQLVTLCRELDDGMRPNLGSWYLNPERHMTEILLVIIIGISILNAVPFQKIASKKRICNPMWVKFITIFCLSMVLTYKSFGHKNKIFYMVMPCNMKWMLYAALCFGPRRIQPTILQLLMSYTGLAFVAVATPDTEDCIMFLEKPFFFVNHYMLLILPLVYMWNGSISIKNLSLSTHFLWWVVSCVYFGLFYIPVVTPLGVISGLNLNYMLNPPPDQSLCIGDNYRITSTICCAVMFALWRGVMVLAESVITSISIRVSPKTANKKSP